MDLNVDLYRSLMSAQEDILNGNSQVTSSVASNKPLGSHARLLAKLNRRRRKHVSPKNQPSSKLSNSATESDFYEGVVTEEELQELRLTINQRERKRMQDLNSAMDGLRCVLPYAGSPPVRKLSKIATLLLAKNYILLLSKTIEQLQQQATSNVTCSCFMMNSDSFVVDSKRDLKKKATKPTDCEWNDINQPRTKQITNTKVKSNKNSEPRLHNDVHDVATNLVLSNADSSNMVCNSNLDRSTSGPFPCACPKNIGTYTPYFHAFSSVLTLAQPSSGSHNFVNPYASNRKINIL
ncbi:hypothetical protein P879_08275 [Paragonimus westermani]|uniref:BHLH domain-containing protein n=1 Tax=Paragonimus westermani TaxID=34504 RepID=A0A8T0CYI5_9TREM|nr:hypothetical protein P879_08275 [Paragonimus westermani]